MRIISYKQNEKDRFEILCRQVFRFLETDFNYKLASIKRDAYGTYIIYSNLTTAIKIIFSPIDGGLFIELIRLTGGKIPPYPKDHFEFTNVLILRKTSFKINDPTMDELMYHYHALKKALLQRTHLLKKYCIDIIRGDFTIFPELEKIVKKRSERPGANSGENSGDEFRGHST